MTAIQSGANPPTRPMPAFLKNMMQANQNIICTASADAVGKASIAVLLGKRLRIPIFQRRYCWGQDQWDTLLNDAMVVVRGQKEKHSLGRITCVKDEADDGRLLVVDGQQRNTTCTLLLAAIRDVLMKNHSGDASCQELVEHLNGVLFPDAAGYQAWLATNTQLDSIAEGTSLDFAALVPTYCDRASYFAAILPPAVMFSAKEAAQTGEWQRPWEAKAHFIEKLTSFSVNQLMGLADVVLHKLEWLLFPISVNRNYKDGTEDLQVIFERLALRDATFCKPSRASEFASMGAADFIRNLLLGSFSDEGRAVDMYKSHWLPIEKAAAAASIRSKNSNIADVLETMINKFLDAQPEKTERENPTPFQVGGQLYPRFRKWFSAAQAADSTIHSEEKNDREQELKTEALVRRLQNFAVEYFKHGALEQEPAGYQRAMKTVSKWRCKRCSFSNSSGSHCTTCLAPRPSA